MRVFPSVKGDVLLHGRKLVELSVADLEDGPNNFHGRVVTFLLGATLVAVVHEICGGKEDGGGAKIESAKSARGAKPRVTALLGAG